MAGVINIITRKQAADSFSFHVSTQYGSFNQNQERAEVSGPIGPLTLSVNAEHSATDGFRDRSAYRSIGGGTTLGLDIGRLSSSLMLSYSRLFYELPGPLVKAEMDGDPTQSSNPSDESNNQYLNASLGVTYDPGANLLIDGTLSYGLKLIQSDVPSNFTGKYSDLLIQSSGVTPKLQVDMDILRGNRLIFGVDGYYDLLQLDLFTNEHRTTTTDEYKIGRLAAGVYVSDDLEVLPMLTLSGGARYEIVSVDAQTLKTSGATIDDRSVVHSVVFDASLLFRPTPVAKVWLGCGTVFRNPFIDEFMDLYHFGLAVPFNTNLKPENGLSLEVGTELSLRGLLKLAGNAFWLDMKDEIAYDGGVNLNVNLDKTRHLGVEAEAGLYVPGWFDLTASYTYTVAKFRDGANVDNRIPLVPTHSASSEAVFHLPMDISLGASASYVSEMYSGGDYDNNLPKLEGYALLGFFVRYAPEAVKGDLELYFGLDNILDEVYASSGYDYFTHVVYYPGEGRSWKMGGSYRY